MWLRLQREGSEEKTGKYGGVLSAMLGEKEERVRELVVEHHHRGTFFRELLSEFGHLLGDSQGDPENEEAVRELRVMYSLLNKHLFELILRPEEGEDSLYKFIVEDRSSRKVKYIAIGRLFTTKLRFLRVRFKYELSTCMNESNEEELFYNTNVVEF